MEEGMMSGFCIKTGSGGGESRGGTKCGRWNPTAEQVKVLTDLFRSGLRTPSTDQIQKISSQLSFYGKIESKNVFYWFQNHKARERQKRRRISPVSVVDVDRALMERLPAEDRFCMERNEDRFCIERNEDRFFPSKHFGDFIDITHHQYHQISEPGREIETLQLFPLNSYEDISRHHYEPENKQLRLFANHEYNKEMMFSYSMGKENEHPPLDLCLSFM
ncbi:hypothetical protein MKW94_007707 [Papaver nudicaule]|uniref:Homeobox domain-containing protein n=1 Tax=Papaver nudicaule TaxID=74823 RepID=A0AA41S9S8_PAPNU|nr:hypothetical protein [Papaver nudicaule]MCL7043571.1 hypothetical protein [Papaver nudicaule]